MQKCRGTLHHQVPESMGGTRHVDNMIRLPENMHSAFHIVFDNRTFIGQILRLTQINSTSLSDTIKVDIKRLLEDYQGVDELYAYNEGVLVPKKFLYGQKKYNK